MISQVIGLILNDLRLFFTNDLKSKMWPASFSSLVWNFCIGNVLCNYSVVYSPYVPSSGDINTPEACWKIVIFQVLWDMSISTTIRGKTSDGEAGISSSDHRNLCKMYRGLVLTKNRELVHLASVWLQELPENSIFLTVKHGRIVSWSVGWRWFIDPHL